MLIVINYQPGHALGMELSSIYLTLKCPHQHLWILPRTHGVLSKIDWILTGLTIILCDSNPQSRRFWKVWTSGVPQSSNTAWSTQLRKVSHGVMQMISIKKLTAYKMVMHHGGPINLLTLDRSQLTHCIGWKRHMNSMHEMHYSCWNSNWTPRTFTVKLIMHHIWYSMQKVIGYTQTLCLHIGSLMKQ